MWDGLVCTHEYLRRLEALGIFGLELQALVSWESNSGLL